MKPLVSILIPAFNAQSWIVDTIHSVLTQTWPRIEVIIVDDGSTDDTVNIVRQYESSILKLIRQENGGACRARNLALRECQGDYIQWLDADDLIAPNKIERQIAVAETDLMPSDVLYTSAWGSFYYRPNKAKFQSTPLWQNLDAIEWLILWFSNTWMMFPAVWLVNRWLTDQAGPWDERLARNQDGEYFCRVISHCKYIKFVSESRSYYREINPSSISSSTSRKALESLCLSFDLETRHVLEMENSERTRRACISRISQRVPFFDEEAPDLADKLRQRIKDLGGEFVPMGTSRKYALAKNIIGNKNAWLLKKMTWQVYRRISCNIDRLMSIYL